MHPVVLGRHRADAVFEKFIHAAGVGFDAGAWEVFPRVAQLDHVAPAAWQHAAYAGHHHGGAKLGKARQGGQRGGLHAKNGTNTDSLGPLSMSGR